MDLIQVIELRAKSTVETCAEFGMMRSAKNIWQHLNRNRSNVLWIEEWLGSIEYEIKRKKKQKAKKGKRLIVTQWAWFNFWNALNGWESRNVAIKQRLISNEGP